MKAFFAIILSFFIFLASCQSALLVLDYQINRDFYEMHCVNKNKPEMNCHGKCGLKKQSQSESSQANLLKTGIEINIIPALQHFALNICKTQDFSAMPDNFALILNPEKGFLVSFSPPPQI